MAREPDTPQTGEEDGLCGEEEAWTNVRERHFLVDATFEGWRLDQFLAGRIPRLSRSLAARIVRHGNLEIQPPRPLKPSTRLLRDDIVTLRQTLEAEQVQDHEARVLYRDEALVVVDKPSGMLVHESAGARLNTVTGFLARQGFREAEPVHRIDRETSGIVLCAAQRAFVAPLRRMFAHAHPRKVYRALVMDPQGRWEPGSTARIDTPLGPDSRSVLGVKMGLGELEALTHVEVLGRHGHAMGPMADLRVEIHTGRQHQIRVHLAMQGTPIAGDKLYAQDDAFFMAICDNPQDAALLQRLPFARHALHAWRLGLSHPVHGGWLELEAPLPEIWPEAARKPAQSP